MAPVRVEFTGGEAGAWRVDRILPVVGPTIAPAPRLAVREGAPAAECGTDPRATWSFAGVTSNIRYATAGEAATLRSRQEGLGRPAATHAALIPISKSTAWWDLAQDERRAIFEEKSRHIAIGLATLPGVSRRLHHCRDLGGEPFDFLTWFEYAPEAEPAFDDMLAKLRATEEWGYVSHEVDIRLVRA